MLTPRQDYVNDVLFEIEMEPTQLCKFFIESPILSLLKLAFTVNCTR